VLADQPTAPFRWDRLTVSATLGFCLLVSALNVGVVLGELREEFQLGGVLTALHGSMFGVALLTVSLGGVAVIDRLGRRLALMTSAALIIAGVTLFCVGPVWPLTLTGAAIGGLGAAMIVMITPGLIRDHHGPASASAFAAVNGVPAVMGIAFGLAIGAALEAGWSWRGPYLGIMIASAAVLAGVAWPVPVPSGLRTGRFSLAAVRHRHVGVPVLFIVNGVLVEFMVAVWCITYLKEIGGASEGLAPILGAGFAVMMFASRLMLPELVRRLGARTKALGFIAIALGAVLMAVGPSLAVRALGVALAGAVGLVYPLAVEHLADVAADTVDPVTLGAYAALASGVAVTLGPLVLGLLADTIGLRWGILVVPVLALVGTVTQWPPVAARLVDPRR
jgi:MFS family permease